MAHAMPSCAENSKFQYFHEKDLPASVDRMPCVRPPSRVLETRRARAQTEILPEPDAPVDHLGQAGELHD
jgi:hypothetical protein